MRCVFWSVVFVSVSCVVGVLKSCIHICMYVVYAYTTCACVAYVGGVHTYCRHTMACGVPFVGGVCR